LSRVTRLTALIGCLDSLADEQTMFDYGSV